MVSHAPCGQGGHCRLTRAGSGGEVVFEPRRTMTLEQPWRVHTSGRLGTAAGVHAALIDIWKQQD